MRIVTQEKNDMETNAGRVSKQLADLGVQIGSRSSDVRKQFSTIHEAQNELLSSLRFGELVDTAYNPATRLCEKLRAATHTYALPEDLTDEGMRKLTAHQSRYTMERENELHTNALNSAVVPRKQISTDTGEGDIDLFDTNFTDHASEISDPKSENFSSVSEIENPTAAIPDYEIKSPSTPADPLPTNNKDKKEDLGDGIELF
jgi:hypothetical protein